MVSRLNKQSICPRTVIDVGANVGQFAVASAKLFPGTCIHCFEPNPESVAQLKRNLASLGNVFVYPIALGERTGEVEFHVNAYSPSSSILPLGEGHKTAFPAAQEKTTITVGLGILDEVLADVSMKAPILLKLDVQGYEAKTLLGAKKTLKQVDYVLVETSFKPLYEGESVFREILTIMEEQGFRFSRAVDFAFAGNSREIVQIDALFVRESRN